jgi:hypothetical protein
MSLPLNWLEQLKSGHIHVRDGPQWWMRVRTLLPQSVERRGHVGGDPGGHESLRRRIADRQALYGDFLRQARL